MQLNHFNVSIVKSILRIIGYGYLLVNMTTAVILLIVSELLGIVEEVVEESNG
jgi:hypothetical protein